MKKYYSLFLIIVTSFLMIVSAGCSNNAANVFSKGEFYKNDSFGITIKIPDNWYIQKREDKDMEAAFEATPKHKTVFLLNISKYAEATTDRQNVVFISVVEKVTTNKSGREYLLNMKRLYEEDNKNGNTKFLFNKDIYIRKIDGIDFDVLEITRNMSNEKGTIRYYAAFTKNNIYSFFTNSVTSEDSDVLNQILNSVKIAK